MSAMAGGGVIRIKRLLNEEPSEAIMVICKKRKTETETEEEPVSTVLKFAATVNTTVSCHNVIKWIHTSNCTMSFQDEDLLAQVRITTSKSEPPQHSQSFKTHKPNVFEKLKQQTQDNSKNSRYKVVNCYRSGKPNPKNSEDVDSEAYTVFDIEYEEDIKEPSFSSVNKPQYVYDLYYTTSDDLDDTDYNDVSIYPLSDNLVYGSYRDNGIDYDETEQSDDSNDENNWRNDYPDESDSDSDLNEEDLVRAVRRFKLEYELSSDDEDEAYVYDDDSDGTGYEAMISKKEEKKYGKLYARFKAKVRYMEKKKGIRNDFHYRDIDDDEDEISLD